MQQFTALLTCLIFFFYVSRVLTFTAGDYEELSPDAAEEPSPSAASAPVAASFATHKGCQGGFTVRKAQTATVDPNSKIHFKEVVTNLGGWILKEGKFRAPCTGAYFFTFHATSPQEDDFTIALMKNNEYQVTAYGSKSDYQWAGNSALLFLNIGDDVYLELQQGSIYEHPFDEAYTTFSGFLVDRF